MVTGVPVEDGLLVTLTDIVIETTLEMCIEENGPAVLSAGVTAVEVAAVEVAAVEVVAVEVAAVDVTMGSLTVQ